ncbi:PEP-CTERM sorting domain-containing protein [Desulfopila aestuarii]|uniref:PEP-CTERM protein-sorting domain-containing protein n=1 Tax=Desulfopila aestuarii DSM 18488 TaxID=1121416 RepID=A0A1M7YH93_9BACT|nr:PEP-CTERM sorting domain-containing protein [Desulfopila aestuarii]SHO51956.1 PEP-CTERM protein-sorting domain-containing protein [Desulfopila aestuarii DSM 18488]
MKKLYSGFAFVLLLSATSTAHAWHFEFYDPGEDSWINAGSVINYNYSEMLEGIGQITVQSIEPADPDVGRDETNVAYAIEGFSITDSNGNTDIMPSLDNMISAGVRIASDIGNDDYVGNVSVNIDYSLFTNASSEINYQSQWALDNTYNESYYASAAEAMIHIDVPVSERSDDPFQDDIIRYDYIHSESLSSVYVSTENGVWDYQWDQLSENVMEFATNTDFGLGIENHLSIGEPWIWGEFMVAEGDVPPEVEDQIGNIILHVDSGLQLSLSIEDWLETPNVFDPTNPTIPLSPVLPVIPDEPLEDVTEWIFADFWVNQNVMYPFDPDYAVGYEYSVGVNDPKFASIYINAGQDENDEYILIWYDADGIPQENTLNLASGVGSSFDLTSLADGGLSSFTIMGIEGSAQIDPNDPYGFITNLSFAGDGMVDNFTMTAIIESFDEPNSDTAAVPEPSTMLLFGTGLASLVGVARRKTR